MAGDVSLNSATLRLYYYAQSDAQYWNAKLLFNGLWFTQLWALQLCWFNRLCWSEQCAIFIHTALWFNDRLSQPQPCNMQLWASINISLARALQSALCFYRYHLLDSYARYRWIHAAEQNCPPPPNNKFKTTTRIIIPRKVSKALIPTQHHSRSTQLMLRGRCCLPKPTLHFMVGYDSLNHASLLSRLIISSRAMHVSNMHLRSLD